MNRVITINLNGNAYQLEESGYDALRAYLDNAARRLEGNPDKDEIMADIEQAIADKFRAVLGVNKTVVITKEVTGVIAEMGPVEGDPSEGPAAAASSPQPAGGAEKSPGTDGQGVDGASRPARRLYRIYPEGAMLSGVCNGLAAHLNLDVTLIRIGFVILTYFWGTGVLLYLLLAVIVPRAKTPSEKSAASGAAATAQEFIRRAKAGYYEGMKTFHDKQAHREWKRKFKQEMRGWKHGFQREMHENAHQWQQNWSQAWGQHPRFTVGMGFTLFVLKWVKLLCLAFGLYAIYSLATKGCLFGVPLPVGIPVWLGIIFVIMIYQFLTWPIKALRYSCYYQGMSPCGFGLFAPLTGLFWLGFFILVVWFTDRYVPGFHEALKSLPPLLHQAVDAVQRWLERP